MNNENEITIVGVEEVIEKEVKETGTDAHVYVPREWLHSTVKVIKTDD